MSDSRLPRLYGEKEIGRILKRATDLQHREPSAPAAGVTLAELEEIAAEAGIDPRHLRRAALELDTSRDSSVWTKIVGDELRLVREVTLEGELPQEGFERIVATIQTQVHEHGQPSLLGKTLTWRAETSTKSRTIQIVVSARDGGTQVRIEESLTQTAVGLFAGSTAGFGLGVGVGVGLPVGLQVLGSVLFAVAAPVGVVAASYVTARAIYRTVVKRRARAIDDLFQRVVEEARASIAAAGALGSGEGNG